MQADYEKYSLVVPMDVMIDIAQIILKYGIDHCIENVKLNRNAIVMEVSLPKGRTKALYNMYEIIDDYNTLRYGEEQ